jgi:hypothetical protein
MLVRLRARVQRGDWIRNPNPAGPAVAKKAGGVNAAGLFP